ncbi:MAG: hypothetical protein JWP34_4561 [Massilia sp.]|nr:hypothetical protein [Gemmatimonadales bacterium]MDB5910447.1 hypothetical protein [Massilia sp.]
MPPVPKAPPKPPPTTSAAKPKAKAKAKPKAPEGQLDSVIEGQGKPVKAPAAKGGADEQPAAAQEVPAEDEDEEGEEEEQPASRPGPSFSLPSGGGAVQTGGGIVLGIVGYAVLLNWIRGGPSQVKAWLLAKLINKTA